MTLTRRILLLATAVATAPVVGCGDDHEKLLQGFLPPAEYVYYETQRVTGFYVGQTDGGAITIVVDRYAQKETPGPTGPGEIPQGARATMWPDDGSAPIQLSGYEANGVLFLSGGGYYIDAASNNFKYPFYDAFTGPRGGGYFQGYVSTAESAHVYLGSFAGDSLTGRMHFVVHDSTAAQDSSQPWVLPHEDQCWLRSWRRRKPLLEAAHPALVNASSTACLRETNDDRRSEV